MTDLPTPEQETPKRGSARDRQRRRKGMAQPSSARNSSHLNPAGSFKMPEIKIPRGRLLIYIIGAVVVVAAVIFALGRFANNAPVALPNALWIGTEWTYEVQEDEAVTTFVQNLRDREIGTVYAWVSWFQEDASWRGAENFGNVSAFVKQFKAAYPESELMGWVSLPVNVGENNYRLDNTDLQQSIADFSQRVVNDMGFDGVFLNIEPVWDGDENFLALLRKVRASVGENTPIAVAIPPDWSPIDAGIPVPPLIVPGTIWEKEYKQSVALLSDEMVIMAYNSGLSNSADYVQWVAYQVKAFVDAVSELGAGTAIVIGIPTYDSELPGHDIAVENVASAVQGVHVGLQELGESAAFVRGLAIYAAWTTDDTEWSQYESTWVRR
jgi:Glycosyl hydrolases family 18